MKWRWDQGRLAYAHQKELLDYALKTETPFEQVLAKNGLDLGFKYEGFDTEN